MTKNLIEHLNNESMINSENSQETWQTTQINFYNNYDRNHDRDIVQAYGIVLEFGYISKTAAESNYDRHLAGVTINLADVELR